MAVFLWSVTNVAIAVVKWTDERGTVHYSDQAPAGIQSKLVPISSVGQSQSAPSSSDLPSQPRSANTKETIESKTSGNARIDDADAVPYLTAAGRSRYREFLSHSSPRAFLLCPDGRFMTLYVVGNYQDKLNKMLNERKTGCEPYVINDEVVWTGK